MKLSFIRISNIESFQMRLLPGDEKKSPSRTKPGACSSIVVGNNSTLGETVCCFGG